MLERARRLTTSLCIALIATRLVGCYRVTQEEPRTIIPSKGSGPMWNVVGITLKDGRDIPFDKNSHPIVRRDTLRVDVGNQMLTIPVSDVQRLWVLSINRTSRVLTIFLIVVLVIFFVSLATVQIGPSQ